MGQGVERRIGGFGSEASLLDAWSRRYRKPLLSFFQKRTSTMVDREDLVQEVFVRLARRDHLESIERIDNYLFETAANVLTDWRRKQATRSADAHFPIGDEVEAVDASPERVLIGKDRLRSLIGALAGLPERTRMVFTLYHFEYMAHADIARHLGIAVRTVEDHIAKANVRLLAALPTAKE